MPNQLALSKINDLAHNSGVLVVNNDDIFRFDVTMKVLAEVNESYPAKDLLEENSGFSLRHPRRVVRQWISAAPEISAAAKQLKAPSVGSAAAAAAFAATFLPHGSTPFSQPRVVLSRSLSKQIYKVHLAATRRRATPHINKRIQTTECSRRRRRCCSQGLQLHA